MRHTSFAVLSMTLAALLLSACGAQEVIVSPTAAVPTASSEPALPPSAPPPAEAPAAASPERMLVAPAIQDLAVRLGVAEVAIEVVEVVERDWPDASLGCPAPDMAYAQVITPGMQVVLASGGQTYAYHGRGPADLFLCGPDGPAPPAK